MHRGYRPMTGKPNTQRPWVNNSKVHRGLRADCGMKFDAIAAFFCEGKGWNKFPPPQTKKKKKQKTAKCSRRALVRCAKHIGAWRGSDRRGVNGGANCGAAASTGGKCSRDERGSLFSKHLYTQRTRSLMTSEKKGRLFVLHLSCTSRLIGQPVRREIAACVFAATAMHGGSSHLHFYAFQSVRHLQESRVLRRVCPADWGGVQAMTMEESSEMPERRATGVGTPPERRCCCCATFKRRMKGWAQNMKVKLRAEQGDFSPGGAFC